MARHLRALWLATPLMMMACALPKPFASSSQATVLAPAKASASSVAMKSPPIPKANASASPVVLPQATPWATPAVTGGKLLLSILNVGGNCVGGPCHSEYAIERDGTVTFTRQGLDSPLVVKAAAADVDALAREIAAADFTRLKAAVGFGHCGAAADGNDRTYVFVTPAGGQESIPCNVGLDPASSLYKAIVKVLEQVPV